MTQVHFERITLVIMSSVDGGQEQLRTKGPVRKLLQ